MAVPEVLYVSRLTYPVVQRKLSPDWLAYWALAGAQAMGGLFHRAVMIRNVSQISSSAVPSLGLRNDGYGRAPLSRSTQPAQCSNAPHTAIEHSFAVQGTIMHDSIRGTDRKTKSPSHSVYKDG